VFDLGKFLFFGRVLLIWFLDCCNWKINTKYNIKTVSSPVQVIVISFTGYLSIKFNINIIAHILKLANGLLFQKIR